ncbi:hypothetical protein L1D50_03190, partial [Pseudoalteromonas sp. Isolate6]|uniref:hypothetical protein n=1 Tax=Pseudoalteromonas sp. Isolate6 TaxID=2908527 RepID=UPI001EFD3CE1
MRIHFFILSLLTLFPMLSGCSSHQHSVMQLDEQQLESVERLSLLESDLSTLLNLLEQQANVVDVQSAIRPAQKVKRYSATQHEQSQSIDSIQLKLFPIFKHSATQLKRHQALLSTIKTRLPSLFSDAEIAVKDFNNRSWATISGLKSTQEAKAYCRFFSIQSVDCSRLL